MARSRNIKPSVMDNEELAELPALTRLLFIFLWMLADREGRLEDRPKRIAAQALAYDRSADVGAMLDDLHKAGFITRYVAHGIACIQINQFAKHQTPHIREAESTLPICPDLAPDEHRPRLVLERERDDTHLAESLRSAVIDRDGGVCLACGASSDLHIDHIVPRARGGKTEIGNLQTLCSKCNKSKGARHHTDYRSTNLGECSTLPRSPDSGFLIPDKGLRIDAQAAPPVRKAKSVKTSMPTDFDISESVRNWADERGFGQLDQHLDAFKRKAKAKGYTYVDWDSAFMEAVREDWAKLRGGKPGIAPPADVSHDPESRSSIEAEGVAKGIGPWDELREQWHQYKARVRGNQQPAMTLDRLAIMAQNRAH